MWILEIEAINREKHGEKLLSLQNKESVQLNQRLATM